MPPRPSAPANVVTITALANLPKPASAAASPPAHWAHLDHTGTRPLSFQNPWPSFRKTHGLATALHARFWSPTRNFVPVPTSREELVPVQTPDWGRGDSSALDKLKAAWIGHASFLVETSAASKRDKRGVTLLLDPVFSERMSPVGFLGPKRFTPPPCALQDLPEVDLVVISHNHYDHLDAATVRFLHQRGQGRVRFLCTLGVKPCLTGMGVGEAEVVELDWWEGVRVDVHGVGAVKLVCTPAQHFSGRSLWDAGKSLWCSWVLEEVAEAPEERACGTNDTRTHAETAAVAPPSSRALKKLFFAGDTGYRTMPSDTPLTPNSPNPPPHCPAFAEIGHAHGPFDLALLPIGCYSPRSFMSPVHCSPEDALCVHRDVRSRKSVGMHFGTVRGGISEFYEDVREPGRLWREGAEREGLRWGEEVGVLGVGEVVGV
ncbi:uncharacterized protein K452DRAFT_350515 [Aplosporella prunicola CBS 121167]|uniref:Metallo-beta-lactamase domain-containing protein n=1 Tax=Aplosporella prunicola CBS 121167 TaxID=1176127 RepID=A0A6A6BHM1_9PEZI|nr:uncharacterized protein K452DRAFT_350515 [Aplosporella prunicola CBS 121167]KAF2142744.1 hypothetical protein K452DRAFT_350515 [Aplosporella prunicola CBS 121167]